MIEQYFNDTLAEGFAAQNQMYATISAMLRRDVKTDAAVQAARDANRQRVPVYQADLTMIQNSFMAAVKEVKRELGNDLTAAQALTKEVTQQMYASLTKGAEIQKAQITPELFASAVTQSVAGMEGAQLRRSKSSVRRSRSLRGQPWTTPRRRRMPDNERSARSHRRVTMPRASSCWSATWA